MNIDEITDQQERLNRLEAIESNAEWLIDNWEGAESEEIAKRLGLIKGDRMRLNEMLTDTVGKSEDIENGN
jgi:predicted nuclease with TOPRIM domain